MPKFLAPGKNDEWRTPEFIFRALGLIFDLDPCWPLDGPCFVPARKHYTIRDNGLLLPWFDLIWMNSPFDGRNNVVPWLERFFAHANGIALTNALTSCSWFHDRVVPNAQVLCFPRGKTKFLDANGKIGAQPPNGIVLIGMGDVANAALLRSGLGGCYVPSGQTNGTSFLPIIISPARAPAEAQLGSIEQSETSKGKTSNVDE
jgi:hypothetical protein